MEYFFLFALMASGIISLGMAIYVFIEGRYGNGRSFSGIMLASSIYSFGYTFELMSNNVNEMLTCLYLENIGIAFIPYFWIMTVVQCTGREKLFGKKRATALLAFSILTLAIVFTTKHHGLYYQDIQIQTTGGLSIAQIARGPWYYIFVGFLNLGIMAGNILLVKTYFKSSSDTKNQFMLLVLASIFPWIGNVLYLAGLSPYGIDLSPFCLVMTGAVTLYALSRDKLINIIYLARNNVFENMNEIVVIVNNNNRIIDYNSALRSLIKDCAANHIGESIDTAFSNYPQVISCIKNGDKDKVKVAAEESGERVYKSDIREIFSRRGLLKAKYVVLSDITREVEMLEKLDKLANYDMLTQVSNRRSFYIQTEKLLEKFSEKQPLSVIMADIDHFKQVNDCYGHQAGDEVLRGLADLFSRHIGESDIIARYGGEEFIIMTPGIDKAEAGRLAERIRKKVEELRFESGGVEISVTGSFGVSGDAYSDAFNIENLIRDADTALYAAKNSGRNTVVVS